MANTLHSALTGADLHETKGAASAVSGQVPIANGSGSAPFGVLSYLQLSNTPLPKLQLDNTPSAGQALIKVYTTTAAAGLWSVTPTGFTTIWAVYATAVDATNPTVATVATVSPSSITGKNVLTNSVTPAGTQTTYVTVIGE